MSVKIVDLELTLLTGAPVTLLRTPLSPDMSEIDVDDVSVTSGCCCCCCSTTSTDFSSLSPSTSCFIKPNHFNVNVTTTSLSNQLVKKKSNYSWNCSESALKVLWNCKINFNIQLLTKTALKLLWKCSETMKSTLIFNYSWNCSETALKLWNQL